MPFCISCGKKCGSEDRYCASCGQPTCVLPNTDSNLVDPQQKPAVSDSKPLEKKKSGSSWIGNLIWIGVLIWVFWPSPAPTVTVDPLVLNPDPTTLNVTIPPVTTPSPTISLSDTAKVSYSTQTISRSYRWSFMGAEWTWELNLPQSLYEYYKDLPRPPTKNYSVYVTHPNDDHYIDSLVTKIKDAAKSKGYSDYEMMEFAASFVQSLPYTSDNVTTKFDEYPRYPIETLVDNGGDCEDTSILMASIIKAMNYGVVLLVFDPTATSNAGHVAAGIKGSDNVYGSYWEYSGSKYYYLETTGENWSIGEIPAEYKGSRAYIYDMKPVPILTHDWTADGRGIYADIRVVVTNFGTADAKGIYIWAAFDAGNSLVWNQEKSPIFDLSIGQTATITLSIKAPADQHTRILVNIVYGGYAVDKSYSDWFDT